MKLKDTLSITFSLLAPLLGLLPATGSAQEKNIPKHQPRQGPWSVEVAKAWHDKQPFLAGCNFIPSSAINQLEMWQKETWDPTTIDRELGWASDIGFNVMRVYLHDLAYEQDPEGFLKRIDSYLAISSKHKIKTLFVFFDDCWLIEPKIGKQPEPLPGVHNSGWLESPGWKAVDDFSSDKKLQRRLKTYVQSVIKRFADDDRVLGWDLYNEPGGIGHKRDGWSRAHGDASAPLLKATFDWAWEINPSQPLTSGYHRGGADLKKILELQLTRSDIISFHNYGHPGYLKKIIDQLEKSANGRPVAICSEYMARSAKSTFEGSLPILKAKKIAAINWGFVAGKTNTIYGWGSWKHPGKLPEPDKWFHDILRKDGTPFKQSEIDFIKKMMTK